MKESTIGAVLMFAAGSALAQAPSDEEIRKILEQRIDVARQSVGIVVGVVEPAGKRIVAYGALDQGDLRPLNGDTVFEIGSVTKVFTSLLLADMEEHHEVALTDPVAKYLPAGVKMPERGGRSIELEDLATHTSGLPRLPTNLAPKDLTNPYADYTVEQLYQFLSTYTLTRDIGERYEYSNLGGGLLGHVLARRAGMDYEALVRARITGPLGMNSTVITLTPELKARLAPGHDATLHRAANWDLPTLAGAGALRSTANDMLTFIAANLGYVKTPLAPAMALMLTVRRPTGVSNLEIALGWHIDTRFGADIVWHNGGTGGYRSFTGYNPKTRVGVVVLSNTSTTAGVDDIGFHLLDARYKLIESRAHTEITLDPKSFDSLLGRYQLAPNFLLDITRDGDHLFAQATGQGKAEIFPEAAREFFYKVVDAQISFQTDSQGRATALTLHQNGRDLPAPRIGDAPAPKQHKEVAVDPKLFAGYVGRFQLAPNFVLEITTESGHLFGQATGQPKLELFAEGEKDFFLKAVDAQITFETDGQGKATSLILHQNGADVQAKRVP
ncbi:MAG TPA: serine hydrolase [Bryobacteraceae bacterium]|nr:serine hydrolase [Bryobacteraceae bacterium]